MDDFCPPLPPSFQQPSTSSASVISSQQHQQDDEEDFAIGPTPPGTSTSHRHYARPTFTDDSADTKGREEWMLSLPDMKKKTQLSHLHGSLPTSFRKSAVPSQDDSWTKNPNEPDAPDKKKSKPSTSDRDDCFDRAYDREQEKAAKKSKKDRDSDKSLLDLHREKLKKEKKKRKKEKKDEKPERKPFSRETDLGWNMNDSKKKSKAIASMSQPDSRFHSGSRKYL